MHTRRQPGTPSSLNAESPVLEASDTLDSCSVSILIIVFHTKVSHVTYLHKCTYLILNYSLFQAFDFVNLYQQPLISDASASHTTHWLQANRFGNYIRTFSSFAGNFDVH